MGGDAALSGDDARVAAWLLRVKGIEEKSAQWVAMMASEVVRQRALQGHS